MPLISASIISLALGYTLSQFYRAFLAVLSPVLDQELGATAGDLALSSGLWFLAFAAMQLPVGWSLDRFGPRRTVALLLGLGGAGGAAVFAAASAPWHIRLSMTLLGIGCAPALMGPYFIIAREYPPAAFGSLAGMLIGVGSLGNILGAAPLVWVIEAIGWRNALWALTGMTLAVASAIAITVRDPQQLGDDQPQGSLAELLRIRALWLMLPLIFASYAIAGSLRGLWAGPYLAEVYGADATVIGRATLIMGLAMVIGNFLVGPMARWFGGARPTALWLTAATVAVMAILWLWPRTGVASATVLLALVGLSGAGYALLMAHARPFLPRHLVGRGMTFLNMVSIGGVGLLQFASRSVYDWALGHSTPAQTYGMLFLFFLIPLTIGFLVYFLTSKAPDEQRI